MSNNQLVNDNVCLKFYMSSYVADDDIHNPEIFTESTSCDYGDWESVAGTESSYSSEDHVYFFQRTLNFTVDMEGIRILESPELP